MKSLILAQIDGQIIEETAWTAYESFYKIIKIVLPVILGVVLLAGIIYAIVLGVNYSKAEESSDRQKAKERLVGAIVGFGITLVLIAVIWTVLAFIVPKSKSSEPLTQEQLNASITKVEQKSAGSNVYSVVIGGKTIELTDGASPAKQSGTFVFRGGNLQVIDPTFALKVNGQKATITITFDSKNSNYSVSTDVDIISASNSSATIESLLCVA